MCNFAYARFSRDIMIDKSYAKDDVHSCISLCMRAAEYGVSEPSAPEMSCGRELTIYAWLAMS